MLSLAYSYSVDQQRDCNAWVSRRSCPVGLAAEADEKAFEHSESEHTDSRLQGMKRPNENTRKKHGNKTFDQRASELRR